MRPAAIRAGASASSATRHADPPVPDFQRGRTCRLPFGVDPHDAQVPPRVSPRLRNLSLGHAGGYQRMSGTSMAAPQVSGLAARVWASCGAVGAEAVVARITGTAEAIAGTGSEWRHGRVDPDRAPCR